MSEKANNWDLEHDYPNDNEIGAAIMEYWRLKKAGFDLVTGRETTLSTREIVFHNETVESLHYQPYGKLPKSMGP